MPEYLAPGVFVEEVSFRAKSIEGVGTSVAGIVGPTRTGPLRGKPEAVTSFAEFVRIYGDAEDLDLGGTRYLNHTAIAAKGFFDNGGKQLFVVRTASGVNGTDENGNGSDADFAAKADPNNRVTFRSRFPGAMGSYTLELTWRDSENLLKTERPKVPAAGKVYYLEATGVPASAKVAGSLADNRFPVDIKALIELDGGNYSVKEARAVVVSQADPDNPTAVDLAADTLTSLDPGELPANGTLTRIYAKQPTSGVLAGGTAAELTLSAETDLSAFTKAPDWGELTTLRGVLDASGSLFTVSAALNAGVASDQTLYLSALAAEPGSASALAVQRNFDLTVLSGGHDGEPVYAYGNISTAPDAANGLSRVLAASPEKRYDRLTSPVSCSLAAGVTGAQVLTALYAMFDTAALTPPALSVEGARYLIDLTGGDDGDVPLSADYAGEADEVKGSTGFAALEDIEDVSIVLAPAAAVHAASHQAVVAEMQKHCRKMRYRVGIVDAREGMSLSEVRDFRSNFDDSRLALYYPWIVISDPTGQRDTIHVPPAGFVAGIYANTDVSRGVHKAPANEPVLGALRFAQDINRFQQELLNPNGINCLRSFPGRGHRVWGGRTLSSDPEWKYVNVRRYFLYLERSIDKSTQWVVFEPNGERLWANVRSAVEGFLYNEWFNGRLLGSSTKEAYFVRCDRSTMTQNDLDNGRLVCLVGVAPLYPAEFVIFRIGQKTADSIG